MEAIAQAAAVIGVLALLGAALLWLRKGPAAWPRGGAGRRLESLERLPLTPHHSLHLVRVGDRTLLVSASPAGCAVLENAGGLRRETAPE